MDKLLLKALRREPVDRPPVWMMRQAGRYLTEYRQVRERAGGFMDLCLNPELACDVTLQPIDRFGFDAAILFSDILIVPYGLGQDVWFEPGEGPRLKTYGTPQDLLAHLKPAQFHDRVVPVYETVRQIRAALPDETALIGFCGAPWTVACYMLNGRGSKTWAEVRRVAYAEPGPMNLLLQVLVETSADYLSAQIKAGAEVVQIFDSWAGAVPPALLAPLVMGPLLQLARLVKERHPTVPVILFPRGVSQNALVQMVNAGGFDGLGLDEFKDLSWAHHHLQPHVALQGNLDNALMLTNPNTVERATRAMLNTAGRQPGYVVNLGHGVLPETPVENVAAFVKTVRSWSATA